MPCKLGRKKMARFLKEERALSQLIALLGSPRELS
jgi:hypothetical protein